MKKGTKYRFYPDKEIVAKLSYYCIKLKKSFLFIIQNANMLIEYTPKKIANKFIKQYL